MAVHQYHLAMIITVANELAIIATNCITHYSKLLDRLFVPAVVLISLFPLPNISVVFLLDFYCEASQFFLRLLCCDVASDLIACTSFSDASLAFASFFLSLVFVPPFSLLFLYLIQVLLAS